jgi:hypothetical protein
MSEPFDAARRKLSWAEKRLDELNTELADYRYRNPYKKVVELHPDLPRHTIHKVVPSEPIPDSTIDLTAEVVGALRTALDSSVFDIALAAGVADPRNAAFPFAGTLGEMAGALGRCKDVPEPIKSLMCGFAPYRGGNETLWALNKLCNTDKHRILQPFGTGAIRMGVAVKGTGFFRMPDPHRWDSSKNEMVLIELGPDAIYEYEIQFALYIAFGKIELLEGSKVIDSLVRMGQAVHVVVNAMEAECRRLKYIK